MPSRGAAEIRAENRLAEFDRTDGSSSITVNDDHDGGDIRVSADIVSVAESHFLIDSADPTGLAQVLVERAPGPGRRVDPTRVVGASAQAS